MQIIIISPNNKTHKHWHLSRTKLMSLIGLFVALLAISSLAIMNYWNAASLPKTNSHYSQVNISPLALNNDLAIIKNVAYVENFYAKRLGQLQAEAIRLKALTEKLASLSGMDVSEFMLSENSAQGGVEMLGNDLSIDEFDNELKQLSIGFEQQHKQLVTLQDFLITHDNIESAIPQGRPIDGGWISSYYGKRIDPFTGKKAFHKGLDLAGKAGSGVNTVADGMVTWIGKRSGYGALVEVDHGNGYVTRYAHNKKITVKVGEKVIKGQVIALMGSTGRSTGPHVHFEILRDGKNINPYNFVKR
ncbi:peptidase M23 [Methylophaga sp. 42_25_T18]|nr:peptidase M23 [Methylophaga sp. 42_25_T18]